ncbi:MAG: sugar-binding protein, partial [Terrimicrobiaceae bacterium]
INTLGRMLGEPKFIGDVRPAAGVRGYAFEDKKNGGVAAVWCTIDDVERGFVKGPVMRVHFEGELPELVDLMGRKHALKAGADGWVDIQLTPAPLFFKSKNAPALAKALQEAEVIGAGSNVEVSFRPTLDGRIDANVKNLTSREQAGKLDVAGKAVLFQVAGSKEQNVQAAEGAGSAFGKMFSWNQDFLLKQSGAEPVPKKWKMEYFFVPKVNGVPDWGKVPAIPITNMVRPVVDMKQTPGGQPGDLSATFQAAWDNDNFYLRVEAEDNVFDPSEKKFWSSQQEQTKALYLLDGCLEVYFDCAANGRLGNEGFDLDDYRYDFSPGNPEGTSGPGRVYRLYEVFNEYAGGVEFPTKAEAAKGIPCEFTRISPTRYAYTITFARKYIAPLRLEAGYTAGFGLYLHDRMDDGTLGNKGLSLATEPGAHCDRNPRLWPLMILGE